MSAADVVIGAASGMGTAVARRLAGRGHRLMLADLDLAGASALAGELGGGAEARRCDVTDPEDVTELLAACGAEVGSLVLTAGLSPTMAPGRRILEVDLVAPARVLDVFLPAMSPGSAAVVLASMAGHMLPSAPEIDAVLDRPLDRELVEDLVAAGVDVDDPGTAYCYAKRGAIRLAKRVAKAFGERGARVVTLSPGIVDTPMGRRENETHPVMVDMVAASPLGRMIAADEVAAVIEFLISDGAAALTGTDVLVDGGIVGQRSS
jgi:NAD(P)-dependent dehydrogenase (short-subunit alcohol dehydrogenase family)